MECVYPPQDRHNAACNLHQKSLKETIENVKTIKENEKPKANKNNLS